MAAFPDQLTHRRNGLTAAAVAADRAALAARSEIQSRVLAELALHPALPRGEYDEMCELVIERARTTLEVSVVGIWHLDARAGLLNPHRLLTADGNVLSAAVPLKQSALPKYFSHLGAGEVIAATDAFTDARTRELAEAYLSPNQVYSLLDSPLLIDGRVVGVLCLEQTGRRREWQPDEIAFARALAQIAAQARLVRRRLRDVAALKVSEERLALAQRVARLGAFEWNTQSGDMWWSDQLFRILGLEPGSFRPNLERFLARVYPDDALAVQAGVDRVLKHTDDAQRMFRIVREDGEPRWVELNWQSNAIERSDAQRLTGSVMDVTERQRQQERIRALAFFDPLTHLPNRSLLVERIGDAIRAVGDGLANPFAVVLLDLDNFRTVNDSLGHTRGDDLLCEVGQRLVRLLPPDSTVARLGGDEFILLMPDVESAEHGQRLGDRVLADLRRPFHWRDLDLSITASVGVACYPCDGDDAETLIRNADAAMYEAKDAGRDEIRPFEPSLNRTARRRLTLESGLRAALARDEFELFLQPCFSVASGELRSCEALVRWNDPAQGLVMPGEFLPLAEQSGLILEIGEWVLEEACRIQARWQREGLAAVPIAVNFSARQLQRANVADWVEQTLAAHQLDPRWFTLEITESKLMQAVEQVLPTLNRLGEMGIKLAVDDFGTGYSSLAYLHRLPLSTLKVDRSFVREVDAADSDSAVITSAVIKLGRNLDLEIIAEGVETQSQLNWLAREGCDGYQGFLRSPAIASELFEQRFLSAY